mmetsp:Transcript_15415/g.11224  ORF Transcript_15415/g.11224 Transcript_15415/m.11224 type:complete len:141 (-) Transcript_15415:443-865(-)
MGTRAAFIGDCNEERPFAKVSFTMTSFDLAEARFSVFAEEVDEERNGVEEMLQAGDEAFTGFFSCNLIDGLPVGGERDLRDDVAQGDDTEELLEEEHSNSGDFPSFNGFSSCEKKGRKAAANAADAVEDKLVRLVDSEDL